MSKMVKVRNPKTKKVEVHTVQNASDLVQHLGWKLVSVVEVQDGIPSYVTSQEVIDNAKKTTKPSTGSDNAIDPEGDDTGESKEPVVETMTPAEVAKLNRDAKKE